MYWRHWKVVENFQWDQYLLLQEVFYGKIVAFYGARLDHLGT